MTNNKPMGVVPWRPGRGSSRPRTADDVFAALAPETAGPAGRIVGRFRGFRIDSGFQPVVSLAHRRIVGHEALLRATAESGAPAAPVDVFAQARNTSDVVQLDRLCRAVHLFNYRAEAPEQGWLFLNVSPEVVVNGARFGAFFDELLRNGTLCALVFSTIHAAATDLLFQEAERRGFRAIIGKAMMDRNAPDFLLEPARD